jgi:uncharacterized membrane protein YkoI
MMHIRSRFALFLLGSTLVPLGASAQSGTCFSDWSAASAIVKAQDFVTPDQLSRLAPAKLGGDIVRSSLCETPNGYVYKLVIRDSTGQLKALTVDARRPFDR